MKVQMVRARVKATAVTEIEAAGQCLFAALELAQPQGIRYATCRLPDGVTYVNLIAIDDGVDNPKLGLAGSPGFPGGPQELAGLAAHLRTVDRVRVVSVLLKSRHAVKSMQYSSNP